MSCPGQEVKCPICAVSADKVSFHLATLLQLVKRTPGSYIIYFRVQLGVGKGSPLLLALCPSCSRLARSRLVAPPRFSFKAGHSAQKSRSRLLAPPRVSWSCSNSDVYLNSLAGHRGSCMSAALAGGGRRMTPLRCRYCSTYPGRCSPPRSGATESMLTRFPRRPWSARSREDRSHGPGEVQTTLSVPTSAAWSRSSLPARATRAPVNLADRNSG